MTVEEICKALEGLKDFVNDSGKATLERLQKAVCAFVVVGEVDPELELVAPQEALESVVEDDPSVSAEEQQVVGIVDVAVPAFVPKNVVKQKNVLKQKDVAKKKRKPYKRRLK